ncbi:MAG TPA: hypothetical protein VG326_10675, partial [Tepidisphaeraceae bacterium]|nr:hypothetical protein [Tepidisphaeraceae bacterium]
ANFAGSADYIPASASTTFTIGAAPTVTHVTEAGGIYTGAPIPAAGYVAGIGGASIATPVFTYYLASDTKYAHPLSGAPSDVGSYRLKAAFAGNPNYLPSSTTGTFAIGKGSAVIYAADDGGAYTGHPIPATGYVADAGGTSIAKPVFTYYLSSDTKYAHPLSSVPSAPGNYNYKASFAGNANYLSTFTTGYFTISKAPTVIHAADDGGVYNGKPYPATGYVASVVTGAKIATPVFTYYLAGDTSYSHPLSGAPSSPGSYLFKAIFAGNAYYLATATTGTITIRPKSK